jgi:dephospho-CoA kinase
MDNSFLDKLKELLENNKDKRVCTVGTTCTGKSTLLKSIPYGLDMDKIIFPLLTKEENDYVSKSPWTEEIGNYMDKLVKERIKIKPGCLVFGTVIIDCDLIVYLDIDDELLLERTKARNVDFKNAKKMNESIKKEICNSNIPSISIKVRSDQLYLLKFVC